MTSPDDTALDEVRDAVDDLRWDDAFEAYAAADRSELLTPDDLWRWAIASFLIGKVDVSIEALTRAYRRHADQHDHSQAVKIGFWLVYVLTTRRDSAQAGAWAGRVVRSLDNLAPDDPARGYALSLASFRAAAIDHDYEEAVETARRAVQVGTARHDSDLVALALNNGGRALLRWGRFDEGMAWLDDAMVSVVSGEVGAVVIGAVYCSVIEACEEVSELRRVAEWTEALTRWCSVQRGMVTFNGQCLTHRATLLKRRGHWLAAAAEADRACRAFEGAADEAATGAALYQLGEIQRLTGALEEAGSTFECARSWGHSCQPGLVLLWRAQGRVEAARAAVRRLLVENTRPINRLPLLGAAVEIMLAADDLDSAEESARELESLADLYPTSAVLAEAQRGVGSVALARGAPESAIGPLRSSLEAWMRSAIRTPQPGPRSWSHAPAPHWAIIRVRGWSWRRHVVRSPSSALLSTSPSSTWKRTFTG